MTAAEHPTTPASEPREDGAPEHTVPSTVAAGAQGHEPPSASGEAVGDEDLMLDGGSVDDETGGGDEADGRVAKLKAEAKRYRLELRATEEQRNALTERVGRLEQAEVERIASSLLVLPDALDDVRDRLTLDELRGDDGHLDAAKTTAALEALRESRPHWFGLVPVISLDSGARSYAAKPEAPSFGGALARSAGH